MTRELSQMPDWRLPDTAHAIGRILRTKPETHVATFVGELASEGYPEEDAAVIIQKMTETDPTIDFNPQTHIIRHRNNWPFN